MPLPSFLRSFNCASGNSSSLQRKDSTLKRRKSTKSNQNLSMNHPSAPIPADNVSDISSAYVPNNTYRDSDQYADEHESFWKIGNYKYALKRCTNGQKVGSDLADMISERAKLEDEYAKSLRQWNKKWNDYLEDSPEYGTTKEGWRAFLEAGNKTADVHFDLARSLINKPVAKIKNWLKTKYEKSTFDFKFKQTREFESEFKSAEKSWVDLNDKLQRHKKEYYESIKASKHSDNVARSAQTNPKINQEQRDKLEEKSQRAREEEEKARKRYQDTLTEIELYKQRHIEKMTEVFNRTQNFEQERILFFKQTLIEAHDYLKIHNDERFDQLFNLLVHHLNLISPMHDLDWWSKNYGVDMQAVWPSFEEYQEK